MRNVFGKHLVSVIYAICGFLDFIFNFFMPGTRAVDCLVPGNIQHPGIEPSLLLIIRSKIVPYFNEYILKDIFRLFLIVNNMKDHTKQRL